MGAQQQSFSVCGPLTWHRLVSGAIGLVFFCLALPTQAQTSKPYTLVVTISDSPDPAASQGTLIYSISVKNRRDVPTSIRTLNAQLQAPLPDGTTFVKCTTSIDTKTLKRCQEAGGIITATFGAMGANVTRKVTLTVKAPQIDAVSAIQITGTATGENAFKGDDTESTTVLAPNTTAILSPSQQQKDVHCGDTLDSAFFGSDTSAELTAGLGCAKTAFGLRVDASNVTLNLGGKKIVGEPRLGNTGIVIGAGATNVTVNGGGTNGQNGIEFFDWCLKDEGDNGGLAVKELRCFRSRSAALDIASNNVLLEKLKIDNTVFVTAVTAELPGGFGIHASGDNVRIKDTVVRRSATIGVWLDGFDSDASGRAGSIDGNVTSSSIEDNSSVGIFLQHGPHLVKDTSVKGDGFEDGDSTDGVVVDATGVNVLLDGLVVKEFHGNGIVDSGLGTRIESCGIEVTAGDSFVIQGANAWLNNNSAKAKGDGFVVVGPDATLTSNNAEKVGGIGFVISGPHAVLLSNSATEGLSHGYFLNGDNARLETNGAEKNKGRGLRITGNGNLIENSKVKENKTIGMEVLGQNNSFRNNGVEKSTGLEWSIGINNIDLENNSANGRHCIFTAAGGTCE